VEPGEPPGRGKTFDEGQHILQFAFGQSQQVALIIQRGVGEGTAASGGVNANESVVCEEHGKMGFGKGVV